MFLLWIYNVFAIWILRERCRKGVENGWVYGPTLSGYAKLPEYIDFVLYLSTTCLVIGLNLHILTRRVNIKSHFEPKVDDDQSAICIQLAHLDRNYKSAPNH